MNNNKLILHAIVMKKEFYKTANQAINKAIEMFPDEKIKGFVRETHDSFRIRVRPKTQFIETSYVSKIINDGITLVFGFLRPTPPPTSITTPSPIRKIHYVDFDKLQKYKNKV